MYIKIRIFFLNFHVPSSLDIDLSNFTSICQYLIEEELNFLISSLVSKGVLLIFVISTSAHLN